MDSRSRDGRPAPEWTAGPALLAGFRPSPSRLLSSLFSSSAMETLQLEFCHDPLRKYPALYHPERNRPVRFCLFRSRMAVSAFRALEPSPSIASPTGYMVYFRPLERGEGDQQGAR